MSDDILQGWTPPIQFTINETPSNMGYYLADDIYLDWSTFVKTITMSQDPRKKLFTKCQEAARKDVGRAFDVLKSWFVIICGPSRAWNIDIMKGIMLTCIILHNVIVKDKQDMFNGKVDVDYDHVENDISNVKISCSIPPNIVTYLQIRRVMHKRGIHQLEVDFV